MPVFGHALVGWVTAVCTLDRRAETREAPRWFDPFRVPAFLALAYFPDIAARVGVELGHYHAGAVTHSVGFAVGASGALAIVASSAIPPRRMFGLALFSMVVHDLMDLAQAGDRWIAWPFIAGPIGPEIALVPRDLGGEAMVVAAVAAGWWLVERRRKGPPPRRTAPSWHRWLTGALTVFLLACALITHQYRDIREDQLATAMRHLAEGRHQDALEWAAAAERWPSPAKAGRVDYIRGEAYDGLGDKVRAETYYLRAYAADPDYFWVIADLAAFYAGSTLAYEQRARMVEPYVERLRKDFAHEPALSSVLSRITRRLSTP